MEEGEEKKRAEVKEEAREVPKQEARTDVPPLTLAEEPEWR